MRRELYVVDHAAELGGGQLALLHSLPYLRQEWHVTAVLLTGDSELEPELARQAVPVRTVAQSQSLLAARRGGSLRYRHLLHLARSAAIGVTRLSWALRHADAVYVNSTKALPFAVLAGRMSGRPIIFHARDILSDVAFPDARVRALLRWCVSRCSVVIANSRTTAQSLPRTDRVVPSPIASEFFGSPTARPSGRVTVGIVGRLDPWKGQDLFLRAVARSEVDVDLVVAGGPLFGRQEYADDLRTLAGSLHFTSQPRFLGHVSDVKSLMDTLDVVVVCTRGAEPWGQVVVQGMARGCCVVAPAAGGPGEIISHGEDGWLYEPESVPALADALRHLMVRPGLRQDLGRKAASTARQYEAARTMPALLEVIGSASHDAASPVRQPGGDVIVPTSIRRKQVKSGGAS
jgi:glycosyltransferase involved in cell wall biosynthesis